MWRWPNNICVGKLTIIASDNGLSPGRRQAIIWTNAGISLIGHLETNFNEILIEIHTFSFKKMHLKMSPAKWRPFCLNPNVLTAFLLDITWGWMCWMKLDLEVIASKFVLNTPGNAAKTHISENSYRNDIRSTSVPQEIKQPDEFVNRGSIWPRTTKLLGIYWFHSVHCPPVRPSVPHPLSAL